MTSQPTITPAIEMTGAALTAAYAAGELTPVDAAESVLADIAARNGVINAFTDLDPAQVLQNAAASAARWERERAGDQCRRTQGSIHLDAAAETVLLHRGRRCAQAQAASPDGNADPSNLYP